MKLQGYDVMISIGLVYVFSTVYVFLIDRMDRTRA